MGCCFKKESSSIAIPLVLDNGMDTDRRKLSGYRFIRPLNSNTKWTANSYYSLISTLETNLSTYNIPAPLIVLIASYSHIGLKIESNHGLTLTETIEIDCINRLLIHYVPDCDITHYKMSGSPIRYDYIKSDRAFKPLPLMMNIMGHILYFEVRFMLNFGMMRFLKDSSMGISVGFRSEHWYNYIDRMNGAINGGMLGWSKGAIGLHNDDGKVFCTEFNDQHIADSGRKTLEKSFGQKYGDIVGCGYNYYTKHVFFTKNGKLISSEKVDFIDLDSSFDATLVFLSKINMITSDEFKQMNTKQRECLVEFNFGAKQFEFDIDDYNGQTIPRIMSFMNDIYH